MTAPRWDRVAAVALIVLIAVNLRPAVTAVGPLLPEIRDDLGLSSVTAGALTTVPVLCFGLFGLFAPALRHRFRDETLLLAGMGLLAIALLVRVGPSPLTLFAGALLCGIAISVGNVVMPAIIKRDHPAAITLVTSVYTIALTMGAGLASGAVVPIEQAMGSGWRLPLGLLAVPAVLAGLGWLLRARRMSTAAVPPAKSAGLWRDRLAWQVTAFMGIQSLLAYVVFGWLPTICQDRGMGEVAAGFVLSVSCVVQATGALAVPVLERRFRDQRPLVIVLTAMTAVGFAGVAWAPLATVWLWTVILGLGQGAVFALALAFIGLRAGDAHVAARLSGMAQGIGYLIAAVGPLAVGALYDLSGGWTVPVAVLVVLCGIEAIPGFGAGRAVAISPESACSARR